VAVILSGANADGSSGLYAVKARGGHTIAQDPLEASSPQMPSAAIERGLVDEILTADGIAQRLRTLCQSPFEFQGTAP
jgi:chemotaxis response regulator CheB